MYAEFIPQILIYLFGITIAYQFIDTFIGYSKLTKEDKKYKWIKCLEMILGYSTIIVLCKTNAFALIHSFLWEHTETLFYTDLLLLLAMNAISFVIIILSTIIRICISHEVKIFIKEIGTLFLYVLLLDTILIGYIELVKLASPLWAILIPAILFTIPAIMFIDTERDFIVYPVRWGLYCCGYLLIGIFFASSLRYLVDYPYLAKVIGIEYMSYTVNFLITMVVLFPWVEKVWNIYKRHEKDLALTYLGATMNYKEELSSESEDTEATLKRTRRSKKLAYLLRHSSLPDENGWISIDILRKQYNYSIEELQELVNTDTKNRFELSKDNTSIRARYGHSKKVAEAISYEESIPETPLYHGTTLSSLKAIFTKGIKPMERQYVHLSNTIEEATLVAQRRGTPIILVIDTQKMVQDEIKFYRTSNGIWLCDYIDPEYVSIQQ